MNNTIKPELDALYTLRNDLKLALIQRILVNDFDSEDTNEIIQGLVQVQYEIEKIGGDKVEQDD